jgi:hypothetical protein
MNFNGNSNDNVKSVGTPIWTDLNGETAGYSNCKCFMRTRRGKATARR